MLLHDRIIWLFQSISNILKLLTYGFDMGYYHSYGFDMVWYGLILFVPLVSGSIGFGFPCWRPFAQLLAVQLGQALIVLRQKAAVLLHVLPRSRRFTWFTAAYFTGDKNCTSSLSWCVRTKSSKLLEANVWLARSLWGDHDQPWIALFLQQSWHSSQCCPQITVPKKSIKAISNASGIESFRHVRKPTTYKLWHAWA